MAGQPPAARVARRARAALLRLPASAASRSVTCGSGVTAGCAALPAGAWSRPMPSITIARAAAPVTAITAAATMNGRRLGLRWRRAMRSPQPRQMSWPKRPEAPQEEHSSRLRSL